MEVVIDFAQDTFDIPLGKQRVSLRILQLLIFSYQVQFKGWTKPRSELKGDVLVRKCPTITSGTGDNTDCSGLLNPFFRRQGKSIRPGIFFKGIEFDAFKKDAGANAFSLTPKEWIEKTAAIGIISRPGRNGGTFAHKDIAFEFGTWLSPAFKLYLIREYQKLKDAERNPLLAEWNVKRILSKVNYDLHTEAVRDYIVPTLMDESQIKFAYTSEADLLNLALFHYTAKQWREANPGLAEKGLNPRDMASISELVVLGNLENVNALLIKQDLDRKRRYEILSEIAASQLKSLKQSNPDNRFRALPNASPELPE